VGLTASIACTDGAHSTWTRVVGLAAHLTCGVGSKAGKVDLEMRFRLRSCPEILIIPHLKFEDRLIVVGNGLRPG